MEPLAQIISLTRPSGLVWKQLEASGSWAIRFPANNGVVFNYVMEGSCLFGIDGTYTRLEQGDFLMLVRPPVWTLGSEASCQPIDYVPGHHAVTRLEQGVGPVTTTAGGRFVLEEMNSSLLFELLPQQTLLRASAGNPGLLGAILDLLGREARSKRPGQGFALERLMELLLVEVIRNPQAFAQPCDSGLLQGLADPQLAKAIDAMHADTARHWSVAELASCAGMSRSGFAAHFSAAVGSTPIDYLARLRMALAKRALRDGRRLAEVAELVGYQSVSAFSTAFTKAAGCPPSVFALGAVDR